MTNSSSRRRRVLPVGDVQSFVSKTQTIVLIKIYWIHMLIISLQRQRKTTKSTASWRRSDLVVCPERRSSSQRRSTDECPTPVDVSKTKIGRKNCCQHWRKITDIWAVLKMCFTWSVQDVLDSQIARYEYLIQWWKERIHVTNIWTNIWSYPTTVLQVCFVNIMYKQFLWKLPYANDVFACFHRTKSIEVHYASKTHSNNYHNLVP